MKKFMLEEHDVLLLTAAAECLDRAAQARAVIKREGLTVMAKSGLRQHPAVQIERDSKALFARLLRELCLDDEGPTEPYSRLPRLPLKPNRHRSN